MGLTSYSVTDVTPPELVATEAYFPTSGTKKMRVMERSGRRAKVHYLKQPLLKKMDTVVVVTTLAL